MGYVYGHVAVVGIDGMGNFNRFTFTPEMDRIFENGAYTNFALSLAPTISAQNWGAMLLGTTPEVHGLTNDIVSTEEYKNKTFPSFFTTVRKAFPDAFLCSCCNWNPINHGIIEHDVDVEMHTAQNDEILTGIIEECVSRKPKLLFIQFDDVDGGGHGHGYGKEGHLKSIREADGRVGRVYRAYEKAGIIDDTLFIVIADHGGYIRGHGGYTDGEKYIYLALAGKTVKKGEIPYAQTKDINAIVLHAFGLDVPACNIDGYSSQIPENIFTDADTPYIMPEPVEFKVESRPTPPINSEKGLYSFFSPADIKLALFFDNSVKDETGKYVFAENGHIKYYSTGVRGFTGEPGVTGSISCPDVKFGKESFSFAVWLRVSRRPEGKCFVCANRAAETSGAGFTLSFDRDVTEFITGTDDGPQTQCVMPYKNDSAEWLHVIYSVDRENKIVDVFHNFEHKKTFNLPDSAEGAADRLPFTVGDDLSFSNRERNLIFNLDDFIVFGKPFRESDASALAEYYNIR
jgi:hypothetical protein